MKESRVTMHTSIDLARVINGISKLRREISTGDLQDTLDDFLRDLRRAHAATFVAITRGLEGDRETSGWRAKDPDLQ